MAWQDLPRLRMLTSWRFSFSVVFSASCGLCACNVFTALHRITPDAVPAALSSHTSITCTI
ncbi:hypothetical protein HYPSUDRAFT_48138 [Hypholoma sublateritium FD-334 SS-4]|uniref:Uncharacterized protein n=1 Tax=Hypholoma sublateritium (strain FD-334 SS-4) TaxID=945553 RepID=A0A0D2KLY2_HYPSF|nr:hypothetical protein HYPSUDRAFT_48138 [Hypholoma sublateritium FD-334 SS-4]